MTQEPEHAEQEAGLAADNPGELGSLLAEFTSTLQVENHFEWPSMESPSAALFPSLRQGLAHLDAYYATSRKEELDAWRITLEGITKTSAYHSASPMFKAGVLYRLGVAIQWTAVLYTIDAQSEDAIQQWREVISMTPHTSRLSVRSKYNIATAWVNAYRQNQDPMLLDRAVDLLNECLDSVEVGTPEVALCWEGKSLALEQRYLRFGNPPDLERSLAAAETCVELMGKSNLEVRYLMRLASVCQSRYDQRGDLEDLDRALELYARVESKLQTGSMEWLGFLGPEVTSAYRSRFETSGTTRDLEHAIEIDQMRLQYVSPTSTSYELTLMSYATSLHLLFGVTRSRKHADEQIECLIRAIDLRREEHAHKATLYTNLGAALFDRYLEFRELNDLRAAIDAHETALSLASKPRLTSSQLIIISNLASTLMHLNLSVPEETSATRIEELVELVCVSGLPIYPQIAFKTALDAARWAQARTSLENAASYYQLSLRAAYQLFKSQTLAVNMLTRIRDMRSLPSEAAFILAKIRKNDAAVTALEQGRALMLTESLGRKQAQLNVLANNGYLELVESYRRAAHALDSLTRKRELMQR